MFVFKAKFLKSTDNFKNKNHLPRTFFKVPHIHAVANSRVNCKQRYFQ